MLTLRFDVGENRYFIPVTQVKEILPMVKLHHSINLPPAVAGTFNYRGSPTAVVDLSVLLIGKSAPLVMNTRLLIVVPSSGPHQGRRIGTIVEKLFETLDVDPSELTPPPIEDNSAPYLGSILKDSRGVIQCLKIEELIPKFEGVVIQ